MAERCNFDIRASVAVVRHEFHHSWIRGFQAIGGEINNVFSRSREVIAPEKPFPDFAYEIVDGRLHWPRDELPAEYHYRANISFLKDNGGTKAEINKAKLELKGFREVQRRALSLDDGQSIMWLAQRTTEAAGGVALQQIRKDGDKLIQSSRLLPFDQQAQIDVFIDGLNQGREVASVSDDIGGWIVQGKSLDFQNELPEQVDRIINPEALPEALSVMMSIIEPYQTLPIISGLQPDVPVAVSESFSFWFMATTDAQGSHETQMFEYEQPTMLDHEEVEQAMVVVKTVELPLLQSVETAEYKSSLLYDDCHTEVNTDPVLTPDPARSLLVGNEQPMPAVIKPEKPIRINVPARTVLAGQPELLLVNKVEPVNRRVVFTNAGIPTIVDQEQDQLPTRRVLVGLDNIESKIDEPVGLKTETRVGILVPRRHSITSGSNSEVPARIILLGKKGKEKKEERNVVYRSEETTPPIYEVPDWLIRPYVFNEKEIPLWQMSLADDSQSMTTLILAMFFLITNTPWTQLAEGWGNGRRLRRAIIYAS